MSKLQEVREKIHKFISEHKEELVEIKESMDKATPLEMEGLGAELKELLTVKNDKQNDE